jgi:DNA processing protein
MLFDGDKEQCMNKDIIYWIWLSSLPRVSPAKCRQLLDFFGEPYEIWNASEDALRKVPAINVAVYEDIINKEYRKKLQAYIDSIHKNSISVICLNDDEYPADLKKIYDPPIVLFTKGKVRKNDNFIAVVGSRRATQYGLSIAERLSYELSIMGFTVVSGMARGIDKYAHLGALRARGSTIAVLGCGCDIVYPPENKKLMEDISVSGAVISEYSPGTPPMKHNFPARNRIISGLSKGVIIVEAGEKSGSLITANFALEQGREVFAVPGNINNTNSRGTNQLIKEGAKMVTGLDDILEEIRIFSSENANNLHKINNNINSLDSCRLDKEEKCVVKCLLEEPMDIDMIARKSGLPINAVNSVLVVLELKGLVEQYPGRIYTINNKFL